MVGVELGGVLVDGGVGGWWVGFAGRKFGLKMFKWRLVTTSGLKQEFK